MAANAWGNFASRGVCVAVGVWAAVLLTHGLQAPLQWTPPQKIRPVRIAVRAARAPAPPAAAVAPREVLPLRVEHAPAKPKRVPKVAAPVAANATAEVVAPSASVVPPMPEQPLPTLSQPSIAPPQAAVPTLPPVPGSEAPPAPPEQPAAQTYPEKPGGSVLVLGLTVNDQGTVIDSRILVPSSNGLSDYALAVAVKGQHWSGLTPPLAPGEQRHLEIRVPYGDDKPAAPSDNLP